ncbi:MAG: PEP/pyruvate-binding domain-containing protein [bacterium]
MVVSNQNLDDIIHDLQERAKELNCLFNVEEILNKNEISVDEAFKQLVQVLLTGWQYPAMTESMIFYEDKIYASSDFKETPWVISSDIQVQDKIIGSINVYYTIEMPHADEGPFNKDERKLIDTIAQRVGHFILHNKLKSVFRDLDSVKNRSVNELRSEWRIILDMLRKTDPTLFKSILRKLLLQLCWSGIEEAEELMKMTSSQVTSKDGSSSDDNKPLKKTPINSKEYIETVLKLTNSYLSDSEIMNKIQKWIQEDKSSALVKAVESLDSSLTEIGDALRKYYHLTSEKIELSASADKGLRVSLLRRFFTEQLTYISIAQEFVNLTDFYELIDRIIFPPKSHGKLGGKSAGLFLAAHIVKKQAIDMGLLGNIKTPKTWYITSDGMIYFIQYNNLEEVIEQKYKEIDEVRIEYPHIVQVFKNSEFPPEIVKGLSVALDDFGDRPIVVRSSSLLEDQIGAAFSGKYKSLFLANRGTKQEKLIALMDAIAEVYSSVFSPDPIEYRTERHLIDFDEEMGIMIQEVVGKEVGKYYFPSFAGVAFSNNEFRWSPRIRREDGLVRLVPGLGTRAVDRVSDDFPILLAPGQPNLIVNVSLEEKIRYSPSKIDVINLETNEFETKDMMSLLREVGDKYPSIHRLVSVVEGNNIRNPIGFEIDFEADNLVVTFENLISNTSFVKKIYELLKILEAKTESPVDIEFACDGTDFYLLQCRPQSYSSDIVPSPIPKDIPEDKILFNADKYISNGRVKDITHIVYVDPAKYYNLPDRADLLAVGRAVSKLNKLLPKRQFILMGPGRWGSRGDIKLGVNITYSDINNTAVLIEIAKKKGNYVPDLSFGTHFFQDLVEASIRYLPLYPDDPGIIFNEKFFTECENHLVDILPEYYFLKDTIRVIDVPSSTDGMILKILMNAEIDEAVGILMNPSKGITQFEEYTEIIEKHSTDHWKWRYKMAERIARRIDAEIFGVKGFYIFGSTKNASAGPSSDIDLLIHVEKNEKKITNLKYWLDGWSYSLSEMNYLRTGFKTDGLLDIHFVTDEDIKNKTSWAIKIGASTDAARSLFVGIGGDNEQD